MQDRDNRNPDNKLFLIMAIFLTILASSLLFYNYRSEIYIKLYDLKLIPRQETFTELYFEDHISLPKEIKKDESFKFSFIINNLEGKYNEYPYRVYFKSIDGQTVNMASNTAKLENKEKIIINRSYAINKAPARGAVYVELIGKNQLIHFLLTIR